MKIKTLISVLALIFFCAEIYPNNLQKKNREITVCINKNIEVLGLIYCLADSGLVYNEFKESAHLLKYYLREFESYKTHKAVLKMNELILKELFWPACVVSGVHFTDFPLFEQKSFVDYSIYTDAEKKELFEFYSLAKEFYIDANLDGFFKNEILTYKKLKEEIESILPDSLYIEYLENFFGEKMEAYVICPSLFIPTWFNFSTTQVTEQGKLSYFILGPTFDINIKDSLRISGGLGYNNFYKVYTKGVHEFTHNFLRFTDTPENTRLIESLAYLNTDSLKVKIYPQGYGNWKSVFEEHLVRACEIKIAEISNRNLLKNELNEEYVIERGFKYIPYFIESLNKYEKSRNVYYTLESYFEVLINDLKINLNP
jgi:hypothetical protein